MCFFGNDRSSHSRIRLASTRRPSTTSERVTNLHITVPAITRGHSWYARASPGKCSGFWDVLNSGKCIWILGCVFGFWEVFWVLGRVLDCGTCFWILGSVLEPMSYGRILAPYGDTKRRDTRRQHEKRNFVFPSGHVMFYLLYIHRKNTKPFLNNILLRKV